MNRSEFIRQIMGLYPHTFDIDNEEQYAGWIKRYQEIPESWDFDKLMAIFSRKWKSTREAPPPSWFMEFREDVKPITKSKQVEVKSEERLTQDQLNELKRGIFSITSKHKLN